MTALTIEDCGNEAIGRGIQMRVNDQEVLGPGAGTSAGFQPALNFNPARGVFVVQMGGLTLTMRPDQSPRPGIFPIAEGFEFEATFLDTHDLGLSGACADGTGAFQGNLEIYEAEASEVSSLASFKALVEVQCTGLTPDDDSVNVLVCGHYEALPGN